MDFLWLSMTYLGSDKADAPGYRQLPGMHIMIPAVDS